MPRRTSEQVRGSLARSVVALRHQESLLSRFYIELGHKHNPATEAEKLARAIDSALYPHLNLAIRHLEEAVGSEEVDGAARQARGKRAVRAK